MNKYLYTITLVAGSIAGIILGWEAGEFLNDLGRISFALVKFVFF